jgi:Tfp pilus assembly protein PilN
LEALNGAFPDQGDVWAKTLQFSGDPMKVNCAGFAKNQAALMAFVDRLRARPEVQGVQIQQVRGDNPLQFSLTYRWEARDAK